jgi:uncharacterized protein (TIGR02145 family)
MKRLLLIILGMSFLVSCEYQDNGVTSINDLITSDYLLAGNLDSYVQNTQIVRLTGKPGVKTVTIGSADLSKYEQCFVLYVSTGTTPSTTVSSAIIKLDDMVVLNTSDFSKNSGKYQFEVCNLTQTSILTVEVRGEPDSYVNVWIEGKLKCPCTVTDAADNIYKTVKIGDQCWMAENLRTTKYLNGDLIGTTTPASLDITSEVTPKYQWAYDGDESNAAIYGRLYTWYAINDARKVCPTGWHVPTDDEWHTLLLTLDADAQLIEGFQSSIAGGKLKETGISHWLDPNTGATNESGFTALPSGYRSYFDSFLSIRSFVYLWTSSEKDAEFAYNLYIYNYNSGILRWYNTKKDAFAVRCIKDPC